MGSSLSAVLDADFLNYDFFAFTTRTASHVLFWANLSILTNKYFHHFVVTCLRYREVLQTFYQSHKTVIKKSELSEAKLVPSCFTFNEVTVLVK